MPEHDDWTSFFYNASLNEGVRSNPSFGNCNVGRTLGTCDRRHNAANLTEVSPGRSANIYEMQFSFQRVAFSESD